MASSNYQIRPITESHWSELLQVVELALGRGSAGHRSAEWWRWKHVENPFGESLVLGAFAGDALVGVRAFLRWDLAVEDDVVSCVRAVDTATHPNWQGKGIFRQLTLAALEQLPGLGVKAVFNTPNTKSGPGYLTMGWQPVVPLRAAVRPAGVAGLFRIAGSVLGSRSALGHTPDGRPCHVEAAATGLTGARTSRLAARLRGAANSIHTHWTAEALRWRFARCPVADYRAVVDNDEVTGIVRLNRRRGLREGVISLLSPKLAGPGPVIDAFAKGDVDYWAWRPGAPAAGIVGQLASGFVEVPKPVMQLFLRPVGLTDGEHAALMRSDAWHMEFADLELL